MTWQQLGWTDGRNVQIDYRWAAGDADRMRKYAAELVALAPDAILAPGGATVGPLLQATRTVPIVFTLTPDPVGAGFVDSLARPGGNATGFTNFEYGIGVKWLELGCARSTCATLARSNAPSRPSRAPHGSCTSSDAIHPVPVDFLRAASGLSLRTVGTLRVAGRLQQSFVLALDRAVRRRCRLSENAGTVPSN